MVIAAGQCLQLQMNINLISRKINCSADIYVIVCSHSKLTHVCVWLFFPVTLRHCKKSKNEKNLISLSQNSSVCLKHKYKPGKI